MQQIQCQIHQKYHFNKNNLTPEYRKKSPTTKVGILEAPYSPVIKKGIEKYQEQNVRPKINEARAIRNRLIYFLKILLPFFGIYLEQAITSKNNPRARPK